MDEEYDDPLYPKMVQAVQSLGTVNLSKLQNMFVIGYNRTCRNVERMEREGLVTRDPVKFHSLTAIPQDRASAT